MQDAFTALFALAIGIALLARAAAMPGRSIDFQRVLAGVLGVGALLLAWPVARSARRLSRGKNHRVYQSLAWDGRGIAWAHFVRRRWRIFAVRVHFDDGDRVTLYGSVPEMQRLLDFVQKRVPGVLLGFGEEQLDAHRARVEAHRRTRA